MSIFVFLLHIRKILYFTLAKQKKLWYNTFVTQAEYFFDAGFFL